MGIYYEPNGAGPYYDSDPDVIPVGEPVLVTQLYESGADPLTFDINTPSLYQILTYAGAGVWVNGPPAFGNYASGDYTAFELDGTMVAYNNATCYRDENGPLIGEKLESPSSRITIDMAEGAVVFSDTCTLADFVFINFPFNHDRVLASAFEPHLHWWKASPAIPNWLIQFRVQVNGAAKTTAWSTVPRLSEIFTYASGTINQISSFGNLAPPATDGLADILQVKLFRDTTNASGLFAGADPLTGNAIATILDVHINTNMLGSRQQYVK